MEFSRIPSIRDMRNSRENLQNTSLRVVTTATLDAHICVDKPRGQRALIDEHNNCSGIYVQSPIVLRSTFPQKLISSSIGILAYGS
jgi:hypothetical protein